MKLEVPKRPIYMPNYLLSWSNGFCGERGQRRSLVVKVRGPWQSNAIFYIKKNHLFFFFWAKHYYS